VNPKSLVSAVSILALAGCAGRARKDRPVTRPGHISWRDIAPRVFVASVLMLLAGCTGSSPAHKSKQASIASEPCAKYATGLPSTFAQCLIFSGTDRYDYIPAAGRNADLDTLLRCHPHRSAADQYARCLGTQLDTARSEPYQQQHSLGAPPASAVGEDGDVPAASDNRRAASSAYVENLVVCLTADQPHACQHDLLRPADVARISRAEYRANLTRCLLGERPCDQAALHPTDVRRLQLLAVAPPSIETDLGVGRSPPSRQQTLESYRAPKPKVTPTALPGPTCAENGSCYGDLSALTGRPKTVHVRGYYRKDGTYVRGHYRSRPRR
jgi:hypothetical protein